MRYWEQRRAELDRDLGWEAARLDLRKARFRWWQWRHRGHWVAVFRHWLIFKLKIKWKHVEPDYNPGSVHYGECFVSPTETIEEGFSDAFRVEWKPTVLRGDTLEGIAKIAAERKAKGLRNGQCP